MCLQYRYYFWWRCINFWENTSFSRLNFDIWIFEWFNGIINGKLNYNSIQVNYWFRISLFFLLHIDIRNAGHYYVRSFIVWWIFNSKYGLHLTIEFFIFPYNRFDCASLIIQYTKNYPKLWIKTWELKILKSIIEIRWVNSENNISSLIIGKPNTKKYSLLATSCIHGSRDKLKSHSNIRCLFFYSLVIRWFPGPLT